ncbi:MAG: hypothetical protein ABIK33_03440 [candidate division WOR-3 bacterium]
MTDCAANYLNDLQIINLTENLNVQPTAFETIPVTTADFRVERYAQSYQQTHSQRSC